MSEHSISHLLSYPFDQGILETKTGVKTLILNASYWADVEGLGDITTVQEFYPDYMAWKIAGYTVSPQIPDDQAYDLVLCALPKQKDHAFYMMAQALQALKPQGLFLFVAANDAGGKRLEKWCQEFGVETNSLSKSKARLVWGCRPSAKDAVIEQYLEKGTSRLKDLGGHTYMTKPGIFGWDKIDRGSALLGHFIPEDLKGVGADFGCGYGYLLHYILSKNTNIQKLYAIDADYNAVECAKENLKNFSSVECQWDDLTQYQTLNNQLDFIVMNPPFHTGKKTDSDVGQKFIMTAHKSLKKGGVLYMVANSHLAYEKILHTLFTLVEKCHEKDGFKIYKLVK